MGLFASPRPATMTTNPQNVTNCSKAQGSAHLLYSACTLYTCAGAVKACWCRQAYCIPLWELVCAKELQNRGEANFGKLLVACTLTSVIATSSSSMLSSLGKLIKGLMQYLEHFARSGKKIWFLLRLTSRRLTQRYQLQPCQMTFDLPGQLARAALEALQMKFSLLAAGKS